MENFFETNPHLKAYFQTSDGEAFYEEQDARNHAKSLEDKTITPFKREAEKQNDVLENTSEEIIYPEGLIEETPKEKIEEVTPKTKKPQVKKTTAKTE